MIVVTISLESELHLDKKDVLNYEVKDSKNLNLILLL